MPAIAHDYPDDVLAVLDGVERFVRAEVAPRHERHAALLDDESGPACNADMTAGDVRAHCTLDDAGRTLMKAAMAQLQMSARGYHRVLKVARTIADLAGQDQITPAHLAEALQYRTRAVET